MLSFMGFMDSHQDVILNYEAFVGALHSRLKQKPSWQWDWELKKALLVLSE